MICSLTTLNVQERSLRICDKRDLRIGVVYIPPDYSGAEHHMLHDWRPLQPN